MKSHKLARLALSLALGATCLFGMAACLSSSVPSNAVAATVNGVEIKEREVADYIADFRKNNGLEDDEAWASWMAASGMTSQDIRDQVIDYYKNIELIRQAAEEKGVSVSDADVDAQVQNMRANYESDKAWETALSAAGTTEEEYRESLEASMLQGKLQEAVLAESEIEPATDEEVVEYLGQYASMFDGAKRSSHILFDGADRETAEDVLAKINSGELDFATAAKDYSTDTASAENGGDVGWDQLSSFVTEYTDALSGLEEGQVSDLVISDYGIHIIKCTEVFAVPEAVTSISDVPEDIVEYVRNLANENLQTAAYSDWIAEFEKSAEVVINEMPEGLPYEVAAPESDAEGSEAAAEESESEEPAAEGEENTEKAAE